MRRSLVLMLVASVAVHAVVLTVYFLDSPLLTPGSTAAERPALVISTQPQLPENVSQSSVPVAARPADAQPAPVPKNQTNLINTPPPEPESEKELTQDREHLAETSSVPPQDAVKNPLTAKSQGTGFFKSPPDFAPEASLKTTTTPTEESKPVQIEPAPAGKPSVVFLLDVSGSMYEHDGGTTRNDEARNKLEALISALPGGTIFTVVYYAERSKVAGPFQELQPGENLSTSSLVCDEAPECGGGTNFPDGLKTALSLLPAQIIAITDGDLNMSLHDILAKAPADLVRKRVGFKIVGIHPRAESEDGKLLQSLADRYGGTYTELEAAVP